MINGIDVNSQAQPRISYIKLVAGAEETIGKSPETHSNRKTSSGPWSLLLAAELYDQDQENYEKAIRIAKNEKIHQSWN